MRDEKMEEELGGCGGRERCEVERMEKEEVERERESEGGKLGREEKSE